MKKVYFRIRNIFLICFMLSALASCSQMEHAGIHTGFSVTMPKAEGLKSARYTRNDVTYYKLFVYQMHTEDIFVDDIAHLMNDVTAFENAVNHLADRLTPFTEDVKLFPGQTYTSPELVPGDYLVFVSAYKSDSDIPIGQGGDIATVVAGKVTSVTIRINLENAVEENVTIIINLYTFLENLTLADYDGWSGELTLRGISKKAFELAAYVDEKDHNFNVEDLTGEGVSDFMEGVKPYMDLNPSDYSYEKTFPVEITKETTNPVITVSDCIPGYYSALLTLKKGEKTIYASYPEYDVGEVYIEGSLYQEVAELFQALDANETYEMELVLPPLPDTVVTVVTDPVLSVDNICMEDDFSVVKLSGCENDSNLSFVWFLNGNETDITECFSQEVSDADILYGSGAYFSLDVKALQNYPALVLGENEIKVYIYESEGENKKLIGTAVTSFTFSQEKIIWV